ncbi:DNA-binding transcriptional regulator, LysR family [Jatrophihabitans endophyticus]|uniref:DNA-binding transcriptional regulator, LysR family n=1 Tax=Jatrophihabitans endophyticus TaxID=1206085 RepID=A0A1M5S1U2_9ACTN|nr:LysR family transcriptional regulator [Jatrophihabitans endophyticus]SHH32557.1 DNA-binding transcriptional regulator, LysR family [Jatrophihabitans endophyticus]
MPLPAWTPDLESLDLLLSVAELGSVGKAAHAHGISQPAASAKLHRLERRVDLALLVRTPGGSTLTPIGQTFAAWARDVVGAAGALGVNVTSLRTSQSAKLRIAASLTNAEYLMPRWLLLLRRDNPALDVSAVVANSHDVCDRVRSGQADLGFVEMPAVPADLSHTPIGADELVVVAAPDYPAARSERPLAPTDLLTLPLLLREHGSGTRDTFLAALAVALGREAVEPEHAVELGSTSTILATARAGGGLGVLSARAARTDLRNGTLVAVTVTGLTAARPLNAVWMGASPSPAAALLVELARDEAP